MRSASRPGFLGFILPAPGRPRLIFVFALICLGLGCLLSACFMLSPSAEAPHDLASLLNLGICVLSPFSGFSALLMLAGASHQERPGPRALAWSVLSLTALFGATFVLNSTANNPDSFALCSIACAPFVLVLIALTVYHWLKARAEFVVQTRVLEALGSQPQTDLSEWVTNLNLSGSMANDDAAEWLKNLNKPVAPQSSSTPVSPTTTQPDLAVPPPKPVFAETPEGTPSIDPMPAPDTPSAQDQLSQVLESSKQALDNILRSPLTEIGTAHPPEASAGQITGAKKNQCPHCGAELSGAPGQGFIFCYHCGSQVNL